MTFRQTDSTSVIEHLIHLSDAEGEQWLHQVGSLCGWGPNTSWDESLNDVKIRTRTLLDVAIARDTSVFFRLIVRLAPPCEYPGEWTNALTQCHQISAWRDDLGFFVPSECDTAWARAQDWKSDWASSALDTIQEMLSTI